MVTKQNLEVALASASHAAGTKLEIEKWSPGDGWTRYRVKVARTSFPESVYMKREECYRFLEGMIASKEWAARAARLESVPS